MTRDRARKKAIRARMTTGGEPYSVAARRLAAAEPEPIEPEPIEPEPAGPEPAGPDTAVIAACVRRTLAAPSVRVSSRLDLELPGTTDDDRRQARGLRGLVRSGLGTLFNPFLHSSHEGFAEPAAQRYLVAHRAHAELFADGRLYRGRPGRPLATLTPDRPGDGEDVDRNLLWPLWALAGATAATFEDTGTLRDAPCRRYLVQADLDQAAAEVQAGGDWPVRFVKPPGPMHLPEFMVWVDGRYVRRVRFAKQADHDISPGLTGYGSLSHLELWDFGVSTAHLDWSRLPELVISSSFT
ncbi:MAG TPA: hypothetical protein VGD68_10150 [Streptosporangiaceae bacterium]